jgi:membrane protein DedA with SNARE-associated domain
VDALNESLTRITELADSLLSLVTDSPITYLVLLGLTAVDPMFPILPAEGAVTAAAVLAGQGQLTLAWVVLAAGLGAFLGDNIVYWIGRVAGRPVISRVLRGQVDRLEAAERQFERHGGIFIIVGRFIPGGRTLSSMSAGALGFSWPRFIAWDALAACVWAAQAVLPGYIGGVLVSDRPWLAMVVGFTLSLTLAAVIALGQRWWQRRGQSSDATALDLADPVAGRNAETGASSQSDQAGPRSQATASGTAAGPDATRAQ